MGIGQHHAPHQGPVGVPCPVNYQDIPRLDVIQGGLGHQVVPRRDLYSESRPHQGVVVPAADTSEHTVHLFDAVPDVAAGDAPVGFDQGRVGAFKIQKGAKTNGHGRTSFQ